MTPKRISAKFFTTDPTADFDLPGFIRIFHAFIQDKSVPGLLIDVADYSHVPDGPGVVLIGHEVDYSIDLTAGRAGLLTLSKRIEGGDLAGLLDKTVQWCLLAMKAIEANGTGGLRFATDRLQLRIVDRLVAPNSDEGFSEWKGEFEALASRLFGDSVREVHRADSDSLGRTLAADLIATKSEDLDTLISRMGTVTSGQPREPVAAAAPPAIRRAEVPGQCEWDISVEELEKLRGDGVDFLLMDVREASEFAACEIGGQLVPLGMLPDRLTEFDKNAHIVVHCKSGGRSSHAVKLMRANGFENVWNVQGGLIAWIDRIDSSLSL